MDIRQWPLDRIMQLPDWCFGRRWVVDCCKLTIGTGANFMISDLAYPEWFVLWEIFVRFIGVDWEQAGIYIKLGDQLPITAAQVQELGDLIENFGRESNRAYEVQGIACSELHLTQLRFPVHAVGRRLVVQYDTLAETFACCEVFTVVSALPKEVPDWLVSAKV